MLPPSPAIPATDPHPIRSPPSLLFRLTTSYLACNPLLPSDPRPGLRLLRLPFLFRVRTPPPDLGRREPACFVRPHRLRSPGFPLRTHLYAISASTAAASSACTHLYAISASTAVASSACCSSSAYFLACILSSATSSTFGLHAGDQPPDDDYLPAMMRVSAGTEVWDWAWALMVMSSASEEAEDSSPLVLGLSPMMSELLMLMTEMLSVFFEFCRWSEDTVAAGLPMIDSAATMYSRTRGSACSVRCFGGYDGFLSLVGLADRVQWHPVEAILTAELQSLMMRTSQVTAFLLSVGLSLEMSGYLCTALMNAGEGMWILPSMILALSEISSRSHLAWWLDNGLLMTVLGELRTVSLPWVPLLQMREFLGALLAEPEGITDAVGSDVIGVDRLTLLRMLGFLIACSMSESRWRLSADSWPAGEGERSELSLFLALSMLSDRFPIVPFLCGRPIGAAKDGRMGWPSPSTLIMLDIISIGICFFPAFSVPVVVSASLGFRSPRPADWSRRRRRKGWRSAPAPGC